MEISNTIELLLAALCELKTQVLVWKWKASCLRTSYSFPLACSGYMVSTPAQSPGCLQLDMCRTGGWTASHRALCTWIHILVQHSDFWPPPSSKASPVFSFGVCTCGKILNKMHPITGSFPRSCFRVPLHFLGSSQVILWLLKSSRAKW